MQDYTYLIRALREYYVLVPVCRSDNSDKKEYVQEWVELTQDAADAIEALQKEVDRLNQLLKVKFT